MPPDLAPAPTAPVIPAVQPPVAPEAPPADIKKISSNLAKLFTMSDEEREAQKPKDAPPPKVEDKAPTPPPKAPKEEPKIKVPKAKAEEPPPVPTKKDLVKAPPPTPDPIAPLKKPDDDADFEKDLIDEEKAQLDDARAAEKYLGEKYKGQAAKTTAFLKENAKKVKQLEADEIDADQYKKWHAENAPKIGALDLRTIERARVKEDVTKEFEPRIEAERHTRWVDTETPKIKERAAEARKQIWASALPEEVQNAATERTAGITDQAEYQKAIASVQKDYALEIEVANQITDAARDTIEEMHLLTTLNPTTQKAMKALAKDVEVWQADPNSPEGGKYVPNLNSPDPEVRRQAMVLATITTVCDDFQANGGTELKKGEKWFVTRNQWANMDPSQRGPFWTFSFEEIAQRAGGLVKKAVADTIKNRHETLAARGFTRTITPFAKKEVAPPVVPPPAFGAPPAPRATPPPPGGGEKPLSMGQRLASKLAG